MDWVFVGLPSIENLKKYIERFTDLGLEVELTEVDARLRLFNKFDDPYLAQGELYGQILQICLENPGCIGLTFWGFSDAYCWLDKLPFIQKPTEPYLFDKDMNPKPGIEKLYNVFLNH